MVRVFFLVGVDVNKISFYGDIVLYYVMVKGNLVVVILFL